MKNKQKLKIKCPKCKSLDFEVTETWKGHSISWEANDGRIDPDDGNMEVGDAYRVDCVCNKCKHTWRVRGAIQVYDLYID